MAMAADFKHELIIPNEDLPFKLFLFEGKDGGYRREKHWHRSVEIFLILEGELKFYINNVPLSLKARDFVIVNSNEIHSIEAPEPNRTIVVQIPMNCFSDYVEKNDYAVFARQEEAENRRLVLLIEEMYRIYQEKGFACELKVRAMFYELLYFLITEFMTVEEDRGTIHQKRHLDKLSEITEYIKKNYSRQLTLIQVAGKFGFTPTYLSRMFSRYANVSYKTYLLNLRTEYGRREMLNSEAGLNEVALNNGFPNGRAFAKAFEKRYGCLPSEYRKQMKERSQK